MAYLALYREWRPKNFHELVGQDHIRKTLVNALKKEKIAHAYLFSGPRGTGKTTTAKILAKALNCQNPNGVEPCNQCDSCYSIDHGQAMEVLEIDAASNRGIDEIRDLRDKVRLSVGDSKYKIYIIDEVHMLTTEAFNALLKTLEEPPERVVFILATTEIHKIPLTILSRVQRFEFHRISTEQIKERLLEVCDALHRKVDSEAIIVIAQKAEGGLRDALSILDQCLLLEGELGIIEVYQVLGMVGEEYSAQLVDYLLNKDYAQTLQLLSKGINLGRDPRQILKELLEYLRNALIYTATQQAPFLPKHLKEQLATQSHSIGIKKLLNWISILLQGESQLKYASNARLAAELLLVQVIYDSNEVSGSSSHDIVIRLEDMEKNIKEMTKGRLSSAKDISMNKNPDSTVLNSQKERSIISKEAKEDQVNTKDLSRVEIECSSQGVSIEQIRERWEDILEYVRKYKKSTHAFLIEGNPFDLDGNYLIIVFKEGFSFHRDKINQPENKDTIEKVLQKVFNVKLHLKNVMENELSTKNLSNATKEDSIVKKAEDLFGADIVVIKD